MKLSLFGKKPSPEEIEREVTDEIEALVRASDKPPPPEWTLIGGLPVEGSAPADPQATADAPDPVPSSASEVEAVEEIEPVEDEDVAAPRPAPAATKRARSGATRSATKRSGTPRKARAASGGRSSKS